MPDIPLRDILISARQESHRMRHFYLGVEHLFIALLEIRGGLAAGIMEQYGITPEFVIDAVRRKTGKGSRHRLWAGVPNTPRADVVLGIANELALENERKQIQERDLLAAILDENDSIPVRVLQALKLDIEKLKEDARSYSPSTDAQQSFIQVDFGPEFDRDQQLSKEQLFILRRMFHGYARIRVERRLSGGYTSAIILVVTPVQADQREDAPTAVKIGDADGILNEARRYETHVKAKLPPVTARLEDRPTAPESTDLAGIKYTLVSDGDKTSRSLRALLDEWKGPQLGTWLRERLFPTFGRMWWQQNQPYRFAVWREYDWLLPPILTLEALREGEQGPEAQTLRFPIKQSVLDKLEYGDLVTIENFVVLRVDREKRSLQLGIGKNADALPACRIELRGIDLEQETYYRGEVIEQVTGRIWKTRQEQLNHAVRALQPDFDIQAETISFDEKKLPNPLMAYHELLDDYHVNGSLCTIHGDLHPGNILVGPGEGPSLIDFAHTRDGHTLFDWATLEVGLLSDLVMPAAGGTWDDARQVLKMLYGINHDTAPDAEAGPAGEALAALVALRGIVAELLAAPGIWSEYYVALAMCALRAVMWDTMSQEARRLMLLVSALAFYELKTSVQQATAASDTTSPDATDFISGT